MKKVITETEIKKLTLRGKNVLYIDKENSIITPLAMDSIKESGIIVKDEKEKEESDNSLVKMDSFAIGGDHTGFELKEKLKTLLKEMGKTVIDLGTNSSKSCDYPDFAFAVASKVALGEVDCGIIIDASGIPSAITANKIPGIRACTCYNEFTARSAREHNNGNILVMGAKAIGEETAKSILKVWIETEFAGGRHQRRLDKITKVEQMFITGNK